MFMEDVYDTEERVFALSLCSLIQHTCPYIHTYMHTHAFNDYEVYHSEMSAMLFWRTFRRITSATVQTSGQLTVWLELGAQRTK